MIKIVKIFYIHGKFFKIQHVIYVIIWKNFVQIVLTYFISHVHWWYITLQLFSIWWITTDFAILWNINNRKLLFSCIWCPTLLGFFVCILVSEILEASVWRKECLAITSVPLADHNNELWHCHALIIPFINWKDNSFKEVSACCQQQSRQSPDGWYTAMLTN